MTRASDEQLTLDFEGKLEARVQARDGSDAREPASIVCFNTHLRSRRAQQEEARDAKLIERITTRVQHFK